MAQNSTPPLQDVLPRIGQFQAHLPAATSLLLGVAALGAATLPGIWPMVRHVTQIAHEGAHAVAGSSFGHQIQGMTFSRGFSAGTDIPTISDRGEAVVTALVGYLGPSAFGLAAAKLISDGHIIAVLWLALLGVALVIPLLGRSAYSWFCILATGLVLYLVARYAAVGTQVAVAYGVAWFMLVAGPRVVLLRGLGSGDAARLRGLTYIHRGFWSLLWLAGTLTAFGVGVKLLV
jgi:hypothetical protein